MSTNTDPSVVTTSVKIYACLLAVYPASFRREFGPEMKQLFRDQCRDMWNHGGVWNVASLWFRVLPDLWRTSLREHIADLRHHSLQAAFWRVLAVATVVVIVWSVLMAFWTPKVYSSETLLLVYKTLRTGITNTKNPDPSVPYTQVGVIQSYPVLTNTIARLHLDKKLAAPGAPPLTMVQACAALRANMSVELRQKSDVIEITVKYSDAKLASDIAIAIVDAYLDHLSTISMDYSKRFGDKSFELMQRASVNVIVVESARPNSRPVDSIPALVFAWARRGMLVAVPLLAVAFGLIALSWRFPRRKSAAA